MKNQKLFRIIGIICTLGAACLYILGMILGSNLIFFLGIVCAVIGLIFGKKADVPAAFVLSIIFMIAIALELFMRIRDGYTGTGWYYWHLLQHPEDNIWNH